MHRFQVHCCSVINTAAIFAGSVLVVLHFVLPLGMSIQVKSNQHRYTCGQRPISAVGVITAGQSTWPGEFPWHASLHRAKGLGSEYICGGFIASDRIVITAAHCVTASNGYQVVANVLTVRLGSFELFSMTRHTQEHRVRRIQRHGNYSEISYKHDIALLFLKTVIEFGDYVQPICLWKPEIYGQGENLVGTVSGWGLTEYDVLADRLKSARMPMVGYLECLESDRDLFSQVISDGMFCAGFTNRTNVCNGDSGGAFAVNLNGTWIARGIISFTGLKDSSVALCNPESLAGFVNLPQYVRWIAKAANDDRFIAIDHDSENNETTSVAPDTIKFSNISERKCLEYHQTGKEEESRELSYLAYLSFDFPFTQVIDCFAVLISERFLLARADCHSEARACSHTPNSEKGPFIIVEKEGQALRYEIENIHQHPDYARNPAENNLALIELRRNVSISSSQFVCLWNGRELDLGKIFLYSAMNVARKPQTDPMKCFNQLLAPSIMIEDDFYYLVGMVVSSTCTKIRFIKLQKFLPWIEETVW